MRWLLRRGLPVGGVVLGIVIGAPILLACSVPVFRYALERWPPDAYEAIVLHEGPLAEQDKKIVDWLKECSTAGGMAPSFVVAAIDRAGEEAEKLPEDIQALEPGGKLPWLFVRYPRSEHSNSGKSISMPELSIELRFVLLCLSALHNQRHLSSHFVNQISLFLEKRPLVNFGLLFCVHYFNYPDWPAVCHYVRSLSLTGLLESGR